MWTLSATTVVVSPTTHMPVVLLAGAEVPEWAHGLVGAHLLTEGAQAAPVVDGSESSAPVVDKSAQSVAPGRPARGGK